MWFQGFRGLFGLFGVQSFFGVVRSLQGLRLSRELPWLFLRVRLSRVVLRCSGFTKFTDLGCSGNNFVFNSFRLD